MAEEALVLRRTLASSVLLLMEKVLYRFGLRTPRRLERAAAAFIAVNSRYWVSPRGRQNGRGRVLVEGHLAEYGPNYLLRTAVAAKALEDRAGWEIDVVFNGHSRRWTIAKKIYRSFHIDRFIFLGDARHLPGNLGRRVESWIVAARIGRTLHKPGDILDIKFEGIKVGDLVYDDILKMCALKTIACLDGNVRAAIRRSYYYYLQYRALFRQRRYECYVATHTTYAEYGILCRVALASGVPVIETTDIQMSYHDDMNEEKLPTYHDGIRRSILRELEQPDASSDSRLTEAEAALERRLASQVKQLDTEKAFRGRVYTRPELHRALESGEGTKIGFVLAHIFADSPHISFRMLHADYWQWLTQTLAICARATDVVWIVKPHPSCGFHHEEGMVEKMVAELAAPNVKLCPSDLNTRSLKSCADAVVTVHGTAGLEFACVGVPIVLAGRPFYSQLGFTIEPDSLEEYERVLLRLRDVLPLTP